ncbi:MAG TPA: N-6 DNA methylase, partial [Candidatus Cloacimonadota bacterium]|nr:N-6 DNA methylase [Candidatus Cloacimonadota bacterium]
KEARDIAESGALAALEQLGVADAVFPVFLSDKQKELRRRLRIHGRQLGDSRNEHTKTQAIDILTEEIAYEHWHRMLFARFLAENNLLMDDDPDNPVSLSLEDCEALAPEQNASGAWELAARYASRMLPQIFRTDSPIFELNLPPEHQHQLEALLTELPPDVFSASDALGWVYQFWQAKKKDDVNKSEVKIGARELPAVTQLFTEPYMVQFLLDNSLGAWWAAKRLSEDDLKNAKSEDELREKAAIPGVPLSYLRFTKVEAASSGLEAESASGSVRAKRQDDASTGSWRLAAGAYSNWAQDVKDLKILDPCCGSGHFLVATLRMLVPILVELELCLPRPAIDWVLQRHLYGMELDKRCVEIAVFALALAAWTYPGAEGYRALPKMNIACCGLSVGAAKEEWTALANGNAALRQALNWLYDFYQDAPVLGSLLKPEDSDLGKLIKLHFDDYSFSDLLSKVRPEAEQEAGLAAKGLLDATRILMNKYDLVITNVPYLARGKQNPELQKHCEKYFPAAKNDLATVFMDRCLQLCHSGGTASIVLPQNWLFLSSYKKFREKLLLNNSWHLVARLGPGAFETISGEVVKAILLLVSRGQSKEDQDIYAEDSCTNQLCGLDVSEFRTAQEKGENLIDADLKLVSQARQLKNPDARVMLSVTKQLEMLEVNADYNKGICTGDDSRFRIKYWEISQLSSAWITLQSTVQKTQHYGGLSSLLLWENDSGSLNLYISERLGGSTGAWLRGQPAWRRTGVTIQCMNNLNSSLYLGSAFDSNVVTITNKNKLPLSVLWTLMTNPDYHREVRVLNQKMNIGDDTFVKVPFDLSYWQKVAAEKYPNGLPEPYSDDPTQWIFHGHPCGSVIWSDASKKLEHGPLRKDSTVLQVAVARLLGY